MQAKKSAHHMPDSRSDCSTPISVFDAIPKDAEDADARADRFVDEDPFHKILPALLSSEHVKKYIKQIGMLYPYDIENADNFKAASCEIEMGGTYIRWNEDKSIVEKNIVPLVPYVFPANSITYVQIKPIIRLPNYIAMRFNLRIKHVHRGLLLGTGPLVDPGYRGNLVIPIHNLTASDYVIYGGDKLIWAEFTKTSYIKEDSNINSKFVPTQKRIFNQPPKYWLDKAAGKNVPIQNSIPAALAVAIKSAEESKAAAKGSLDAAEEARKWAQRWVLGSALGALLASVGMVIALHQLFHQVDGNIMQAVSAVNASTSISNAARESIDNTDKSVKSATSSLDRIEHDLDSTRKVAEEQATRIRLLEQELCKAGIGPKCKKD
ncbi:hypothetical protein [Methylocystis bryophila]|uniref:hypothetical protein n=1 Tax=Methylocystis bryophila TaxID=655015 RepID=UPI00131A464F|nr:hypothetical protein [Methylocystis bryophila]BDV39059.1 hypothetical protein DSM21852_23120 [Methylocystis bryophila]